MKAFVVDKYKKKGALRLASLPEPELQDNDVLVRIQATAVNQLDSKVRDGEFKLILPYRPPFVLGHDLAGTVVKVGTRVRRFKVGDEVYARPRDHRVGTFAEFIAIDEADAALKPSNLSMSEAASVPLVGLTAWQALVEVGKIKPGQKVFIQAGSGGVGTFAIQLAKHLGAAVATTTSAENAELARSLGADVVIDYKTQDFEKILSGYDLVLNSQDPKTLEKSLGVLKPGGRLISISGPPDPAFARALGLNLFLKLVLWLLSRGVRRKAKRLGVAYSFLFMRAEGRQLGEIARLIEQGVIRPVVDKVFPFEKTGDALAYVETGRAKGKVVIAVAN
ncbi:MULTISPECIES: NADP-dependent oxidoreductase [Rhizobium]|uniref:NADP-dependent oxidoreductase n=1 Tax=Rhizobium phaseoli TaxID=396 RepID=UPI000319C820|nr:NADP-dependent oxidoreductase [Rhizobium phaseoli]KEC72383.1 zinc-binding oxidoreductase [Rhizobium leguminosarum bv. phaseoli CCGM1]ANL45244.1 Zn-dependent alcohol dehydrogenase GroES-like protein [Rhizobium phaseoli]ARM10765.1 Zn-dependent alcohol dehydrogenase GroES-like protein [Rhizobium phaseoli Brasil 5]PDS33274.1 NADPH:quinone oxidoreductase [Rhizobium phaseoli]PWI56472.1 NADPH:quinone oxidoreductase [Rhizobium phaseoli]